MASDKADVRPSQLSEEYVQDSSDEGEESAEDASIRRESSKATTTDDSAKEAVPNGVAPASEQQETPTSESQQSSQESSNPDKDGNKSDGEHSDDSSGSRKRSREPDKVTEDNRSSKKQKKRKERTAVQIPSKPFTPPAGFEAVIPDASDYASEAAGIFTDLSNKQVWHISAPSTVNLSSIEELDIAAALKGDAVITQNGISYGLQPTTSSADTLLLPQGSIESYRASKIKISRGFQLKAIDQETPHANNTSKTDDSGPDAVKKLVFTAQAHGQPQPPRQQPGGLSTRYVPYGVVDRDKSANSARVFPGLSESGHTKAATTNTKRTPEREGAPAPALAATDDHMDVDGSLQATNGLVNGSPEKSVDPSEAKSSVPETPREKQKKKKKRSKLVDDQGI